MEINGVLPKFNVLTLWPAALGIIQSNALFASRLIQEYGPASLAFCKMAAACLWDVSRGRHLELEVSDYCSRSFLDQLDR